MTEKQISEIESRSASTGNLSSDMVALIKEIRRLRDIVRRNGAYRSITYPNAGKVALFSWAQEALGESS